VADRVEGHAPATEVATRRARVDMLSRRR
jgi:hypothetical protein